MKFLCVPCDSPMKLRTVEPPASGSLSIVYACPECGYEMAMLTNAYETQVVQSLGVRIGTASGSGASSRPGAEGASASARRGSESDVGPARSADAVAEGGAGCPFAAMIPPAGEAQGRRAAEPLPVRWTAAAEARLAKVPEFVRPMARVGIERFAREHGRLEVDEQILDAAREFFGM